MSRWSQAAERNRAYVAANAEQVLSDTRYDRFRTDGALLWLVVAYVITTAVIPVCWIRWGTMGGVLSLAPWGAVFLLTRVAVRSQADLPDEVLDERMRRERDRVYVDTFRLVSSVVFVAVNVALAAVAFRDEDATITFDYDSVSAVFWTTFALLLGAPSVVMALQLRAARP